jgi:DNA-binding NarL/FixJ family response regulator
MVGVEPLRVVIADDHPMYRDGLARALRASGIDVVAEAANGEAAVQAVTATAPDVVVMDLSMPGVSGLEATRIVVARAPATRVLVLSVSAEPNDISDALTAGAGGYVLKDEPVEALIAAVRATAVGHRPIGPGAGAERC